MTTTEAPRLPELAPGEEIVATLDLGYCVVVALLKTYQGRRLLDVRRWLLPERPGGPLKPSRKGISLGPLQWREILPAIVAALPVAPAEDDATDADDADDEEA